MEGKEARWREFGLTWVNIQVDDRSTGRSRRSEDIIYQSSGKSRFASSFRTSDYNDWRGSG